MAFGAPRLRGFCSFPAPLLPAPRLTLMVHSRQLSTERASSSSSTPTHQDSKVGSLLGTAAAAAAAASARAFATRKANNFRRPDKSPKGSWDERVQDICDEVNGHNAYFTTSSCSGRCYLWKGRHHSWGGNAATEEDVKELGGSTFVRLRVSHDPIEAGSFFDLGGEGPGIVWMSLQPLELQVLCQDYAAAEYLVKVAQGPFKQNFFNGWKKDRVLVKVCGDEHLDFPLSDAAGLSLFQGQEGWLKDLANSSLECNWGKMAQLLHRLKKLGEPKQQAHFQDVPEPLVQPGSVAEVPEAEQRLDLLPSWNLSEHTLQLVQELESWPGLELEVCDAGHVIFAETPYCTRSGPAGPLSLISAGLERRNELWLVTEALRLRARCPDLATAGAVMTAAGTLFRKPGAAPLAGDSPGFWVEVRGNERLTLPLRLPNGHQPYEGREDWLKTMVEQELRQMQSKCERFVKALREAKARMQRT